ncbi:Type 1 phosphatases regulator YPI1 [Hyphodiscus hymeniophilus]|uniref:Type 1 phosphatases regulator n=1 Tax=Hyphodiscus hymeniophilus TaxID=353542 RepID=A0A9P7B0U8_9HELO|nr:Type 1 phosphatases regulator YPI1 [Hyphodiscus hymeniophilus]
MATISRSSTPRGTRTRAAQAQVQVEPAPSITTTEPRQIQAVLHLRGATREEEAEAVANGDEKTKRRIQWDESVVDNEGLGKKSSKVCCIYHAPRGIDESSDESSSDSDDSESDSNDDGSARPPRREGRHYGHSHDHGHGKGKGKERASSPNAYEKIPKAKSGGTKDKS